MHGPGFAAHLPGNHNLATRLSRHRLELIRRRRARAQRSASLDRHAHLRVFKAWEGEPGFRDAEHPGVQATSKAHDSLGKLEVLRTSAHPQRGLRALGIMQPTRISSSSLDIREQISDLTGSGGGQESTRATKVCLPVVGLGRPRCPTGQLTQSRRRARPVNPAVDSRGSTAFRQNALS